MTVPAFIVIGPSGSGKGSLIRRLRQEHPEMHLAVSWTTRAPRDEDNGAYLYKTREEFEEAITRGEFLEHDEHYGDYYGTPRSELRAGVTTIIEIDIHGTEQIRKEIPTIPVIFITPPSVEELERRIRNREENLPEEKVQQRLARVHKELEVGPGLATVVIKNKTGAEGFERAYQEFEKAIRSFV
ncbi:MAG: guanylate kinase [Candidatus Pacebacteria bacterium]|nr:guanylate kinase [Candidatus Paceibacterota bacterium]